MNYTSLVSAEDVLNHLDNPHWRIVDCRFDLKDKHLGYEKYKLGHIPNAIYADLKKDLSSPVSEQSGRHPLPEVSAIIQKLGSWGISSQTQVVVYDDAHGSFAGRLWWLLNWLGHENVAVLNGGFGYWENLNYPITTDIPQIEPTTFTGRPDMSMIADMPVIENSLTNDKLLLIDVRDPERYAGHVEPIDKIAGHVPGAINVPWKTNIDENGLYYSKAQLKDHYSQLLVDMGAKDLVFMCGSGVTACHSLLAMKYIGISGAKLYPGSWSEWIQNPSHPVETGSH